MPMHAAVPIETTVEGRMHLFGTEHRFQTRDDIARFVRILSVQSIDCQFRKVSCLFIAQLLSQFGN